jgi:hypothetical protein
MSEIWHFKVDPAEGWQLVAMPADATPIHFEGGANGHSRMWAIVDPSAPVVPQRVAVIGTGWDVPRGARHVHTDVGPTGWVWHLFVPVEP